MKNSIRAQLLTLFVGVMCFTLVVVGLTNYLFLGDFYRSRKTKEILKTYELLNDNVENGRYDDDSEKSLDQVSVQQNMQIMVATSDLSEIILVTSRDEFDLAARLFGYYSGFYQDGMEILKQTDHYTIQVTQDKRIATNYLEIWGNLEDGEWFLIRSPLESIENAALIANIFYIIVGLITTIIAVIAIVLVSKRITRPIVQLSELSREMTKLNFDVRYTGHANNEIDQLGENFNVMSDQLEQTISELKSANVELQKDNERKTQIDEMRKEFLNNVSHELKTPIALISGYAEGLKDNIAEDKESRDFYCDVIIDESSKMNNMVRKLLTLNQLEFGNDQVTMERFDITQLVKGVISGMKLLIEDKGAEVTINTDEPVYVWGDEFKIEEVVTNYMSNALNHLDYDKKIDVRIIRENGLVRVSVFNTGNPIPEGDIDKIWDKFYKVDKARTREYGGSGIGLSIVKAIMESHNQPCGVKNYEDGVQFWFTLEGK